MNFKKYDKVIITKNFLFFSYETTEEIAEVFKTQDGKIYFRFFGWSNLYPLEKVKIGLQKICD